jgi:hypothetical protein
MSIIQDVKDLNQSQVIIFSLLFMATASSGLLTILLFQRSLLIELDFFKLIFLSASLGLPLFFLNIAYIGMLMDPNNDLEMKFIVTFSSLMTVVGSLNSLLISYAFNSSFQRHVLTVFLFSIVVAFCSAIGAYLQRKEESKKAQVKKTELEKLDIELIDLTT